MLAPWWAAEVQPPRPHDWTKWRNGSLPAQERIRIKSGWRRRAEALAEKFYDGRVRSWKTFTPVRRTLLQATGGYGFGAG